jgi:hyperosmotically inducible protein
MKSIRTATVVTALVGVLSLGFSAYASKTDDRIEATAKKSYVFKTYLKEDAIKIQSKEGVVTLTGTVSQEPHKALAQETVASLPGVKSVDNKLEVKGVPPTTNSDGWLKDKVKFTLLFHRSVSAEKTEVDVKDGVVTLRGEASNQAQKELTAEYAGDVEGVKSVVNEMTLSKAATKTSRTMGEKIDDASITTQVKTALLLHRSTSALHTTVTTRRGVVAVGGKAKSEAEKELVSKLVGDIHGVKSVDNRMTLE